MTPEEKAKFIAEQCKPCTLDFYQGMYSGVLIAYKAALRDKLDFIDKIYNDWFSIHDEDFGNYLFGLRLQLRKTVKEINEQEQVMKKGGITANHCVVDEYTVKKWK